MSESVFRENLFGGKTFIVTGGGTGIGLEIASRLRELGASVAILSRKEAHLEAGEAHLRSIDGPGMVFSHVCNIREEDSVRAAVAACEARLGRIDGLVNNAGGQFPAPAMAMSAKGWRAVIDTNLTGTFLMTQGVCRASMMDGKGGVVVNVIAQMWNGFPMMSHTGAARAGVHNLTKSLAMELGTVNVRVNAVAPGIIISSGMDTYAEEHRKIFTEAAAHIPLGRTGTTADVAEAVLFLLSPSAAFITGTTLQIDGGEPLLGSVAARQLPESLQG